MDNFISIISIYFFVSLGYVAKAKFKDGIDERTIVKLNIYFLLPMLAFWGLLTKKIDFSIIKIPFIYLFISLIALLLSIYISKKLFKDPKERSILSMASVTGVTGSIGIPLGIALFGKDSVIYTSLINTMSMFFVYTVGTYIYSRGSYGIVKSFKNVFKMPIIWASLIAIIFNIFDISINKTFFKNLQMGAYAAIIMQLFIFGMFLYKAKIKEINFKLLSISMGIKFILIPLLSITVLYLFRIEGVALKSTILELLVPLAITNVSLSSIFDCKPQTTTTLVFISSIIFIPYIIIVTYFIQNFSFFIFHF